MNSSYIMKKKHVRLFIGLLLFSAVTNSNSYAQNQKELKQSLTNQLDKMSAYFDSVSSFSVKITHVQYDNPSMQKQAYQSTGYYYKSLSNVHSKLLDIETFSTDRFTLVVDSQQKMMVLSALDKKKNTGLLTNNIQTALSAVNEINLVKGINGKLTYKLKFNHPYSEFKQIDIELNSQTNLLQRLTIYLKDQQDVFEPGKKSSSIVDIVYTNWVVNDDQKKMDFNWKKYLYIENDKYYPTKKYTSYRYLNQLYTQKK